MPQTSLHTFVAEITIQHHFDTGINLTLSLNTNVHVCFFSDRAHQDMRLKNTIPKLNTLTESLNSWLLGNNWEYEINNLHFRQIYDKIIVKGNGLDKK